MPRNLVTVAGHALPEPATYDANTATIVDSARNVEGKVVGAVIRNDVAKVSMTWRYLTVQQWSTINKLFNPAYGGNFYNTVEFFDQTSATWITRRMYVNDRSAGMWIRDINGNLQGWKDCKLNLIEV
ncbi:hypothetical protein J6V85_03275 [Candidatus Saccharibacteria bacterium]|nr:hypothetical protein [Candidatus Saccharibacteria bacterium]